MSEIERLREALEKIAGYCEAQHTVSGGPQTCAIVNTLLNRVGSDIRAALAATPPGAERGGAFK